MQHVNNIGAAYKKDTVSTFNQGFETSWGLHKRKLLNINGENKQKIKTFLLHDVSSVTLKSQNIKYQIKIKSFFLGNGGFFSKYKPC